MREFEELTSSPGTATTEKRVLFEIGCGVGNFVFPLLKEDSDFFVYACDFSTRAVDIVKNHELYDESKVRLSLTSKKSSVRYRLL